MKAKSVEIQNERLLLHPYKCVYWEREEMLLIADLHLGKTAHFRSEGIAVPSKAGDTNWDMLNKVLDSFAPGKVVFLGDLFHSHYNHRWEWLGQWMAQFPTVQFELVTGNHDILPSYQYEKFGLLRHEFGLACSPFLLRHKPLNEPHEKLYCIAGHIHPAVRLKGKAHQNFRLACFYFGKNQGFLPAFGAFTGMKTLSPGKNDRVFVIVEDEIIQV